MKKLYFIVLALIMSLLLCFGLTACGGKTVESLQNELGALLEGGNFEEGSVLNFDKVDTTSENATEVFEKLGEIGITVTDKSKAYIYDISVTKDGKEVQLDGTVKLTIPVPQGSTETDYSVYHVKDDGEVVKIPSTYADGKLTFETDGFSYYVFVATGYININVTPTPDEVTLVANAGEGGSITAGYANGKKVEKGTSVTLTATANENYNFKGWYSYTADQQEVLISSEATHTFECNADLTVYAKFEEKVMYNFLAQCNPNNGGSITENSQTVDFGNGRMVELNTQITLTAVANTGYTFKGWGTLDNGGNVTIISTDATHTFTVTENTYVQAVFEEKPNGLKLDAHNAGFTYENGELTTTIYQIGDANQPQIDNVLVYATYPTQAERSLTIDVDYTRDLGGLDFTKAGTYTVTYTYKADTSLKATLTVQVKEKPSDGSLTEAEWNAAMAYWKAQTNVKVVERSSSPNNDELGAQIMIYQFDGTAFSEDGGFENQPAGYKGKATYYVKEGAKYYRIEWGYRDEECWVKSPATQEEYEGYIASTIFRLPNYVDYENDNVFDYSNFTYDATNKIYKNSDETISFAFTFENNVLTKFVLTQYRADDSTTFVSTITFGDAEVDAPQVSVDSHFATVIQTGDEYNETGGYIAQNGEKYDNGDYGKYFEAGTTFTLTAVAKDGYVFKHWGTNTYNYETREYEFSVFSTEEEYTVVIGEYELTLYAVFEKVEADS